MDQTPLRRAAIIAVGSELLTPARVDTNSLFLTAALNAIGVDVVMKMVVGDDRDELAAHLAHALSRVDLLVMTGGLGPTDDDVTREAVAAHLGRPLAEDPAVLATIRARFEGRGWRMPEINRRQALVPAGAVVLENPHGTAPGLWIEHEGKGLLLVPGPPRELRPMVERVIEEKLRPRMGGVRLLRRVLKIAGRSESRVEELTQPIYSRWRTWDPPIETTILASAGQIELHLSARGRDPEAMARALDRACDEIKAAMPGDVFSDDGRSLEEIVGHLLVTRGWRIALAESCTGGLTTSRLTDVPGASAYVERSVVVYSNESKVDLLGVPKPLLATYGAVSEPVARAMAEAIRAAADVEVGVGITGIAGPTGGTPAKPVGTVCIAVAVAAPGDAGGEREKSPGAGGATAESPREMSASSDVVVRTYRFPGDRETIKSFAAFTAIDMVRRAIEGAEGESGRRGT